MARQKNDGKGRMGGRAKGTPNVATRERRELLSQFLDDEWENFKQNYANATNSQKLNIYMEMLQYTTPKMQSMEYKEKLPAKTYQDELDEISGEITRQK